MTDAAKVTDTPVGHSMPPPANIDLVKGFIGDLARPFALYVVSIAVAIAIVVAICSGKGNDVLFTAGAILGTLYTAKAVETVYKANADAKVQIAQAPTVAAPGATQ